METQEAQAAVAQAVVDRGYRNGWTAEQFAARQVAKMVEELGEMAHYYTTDGVYTLRHFVDGANARKVFDNGNWTGATVFPARDAYAELCDVVVVCLTMADVLAEIIGKPLDVVADAVAKATADVKRGTRA